MACDWVQTDWAWAVSTSVGRYLSFAPAPFMIAQAVLSNTSGGGLIFSGITQYTVRPDPNGPDEVVSFNWDPNLGYPGEVWDYNMSSVNGELDCGQDQQGKFSLTVFYLS